MENLNLIILNGKANDLLEELNKSDDLEASQVVELSQQEAIEFVKLFIQYGIPLISLAEIIKNWLSKKVKTNPNIKIVNNIKQQNIIISPNEDISEIVDKLKKFS
jgi:hypothetical protein